MNDLQQGFADIRNAILQKKMMKRQDEQRALENAMMERQQSFKEGRAGVDDTRYADEKTYSRSRDSLGDARYEDDKTYRRDRDVTTDARDDRRFGQQLAFQQRQAQDANMRGDRAFNYQAGRDATGDKFRDMEMDLRKQHAGAGTETQMLDPESGDVMSIVRKVPFLQKMAEGLAAGGAAMGGPNVVSAVQQQRKPQQMTRDMLLEAVRTGKMSKDEAKAYAKQNGLE